MTRVLEVNVDDLNSGGVFSLVRSIILNNKSNIKIDIGAIEKFNNQNNVELFRKYGTNIYYVGYEGNKWLKQIVCFKNLVKLLRSHKYNCVHVHADTANKLLVSGLAAKIGGSKKILLHSHAAGIDGNRRELKKIIHYCCRGFLKYIGTDFLACSDVAAKWMYPNISKGQIEIITNGIDLNKFRFDYMVRKQVRTELGISDDLLLVGHVGRFCYQKNHEYILKIAELFKIQNLNAKILLVGEGPDYNRIFSKAQDMGLDDVLVFYGVSSKVQELFMAMDVFILPSHFEGLPIVGVEAQATGLPVVFSDKITKEAMLKAHVKYLPIEETDVSRWVESIKLLAEKCLDRELAYLELKKKKFDVEDMVSELISIYEG